MHRIQNAEYGINGQTIESLESTLSFLKDEGYSFVSLEDIIHNIRENNKPLQKAVCFTIDDGFLDQAEVAAPVFLKYQCPLTIFLISGFLDGYLWPWDFQIRHLISETKNTVLDVDVLGSNVTLNFNNQSRKECIQLFREYCKKLPTKLVDEVIESLSNSCNINISAIPPIQYRSISWESARKLEFSGVTFGCHGVTHHIFAGMNASEVRYEISESYKRLREEISNPLNAFCIPTGRIDEDFSIRDLRILKEEKFDFVVSTDHEYVNVNRKFKDINNLPIILNRFAFPKSKIELIKYITGIEKIAITLNKIYIALSKFNSLYGSKKGFIYNIYYRIIYIVGGLSEYKNIDWLNVKRIIFVCQGNVCRSPFAEKYISERKIPTQSYGLITRKDLPANGRAIRISGELNVDLTLHRTKHVSQYRPESGDLVIGMEPGHLNKFKEIIGINDNIQLTLLGLHSNRIYPYIHDPYNANNSYFKKCFRIQKKSLDTIVEKIKSINNVSN